MFRQSDTSAFFGREVGTHNTHAHLRYAESLAQMGHADALLHALLQANPVKLQDTIPNACPRQSNAYFISSDAAFNDRYEASEEFKKLRDGRVGVKGGWRICSNGPGIFIHIMISRMLGLRSYYDYLIFDPILPESLGTVTFKQDFNGKVIEFSFIRDAERRIMVNSTPIEICGEEANPYRRGGMQVKKTEFLELLDRQVNMITVNY